MTPDDFTLDAVPLRGPLAPLAALLGEGDGVLLDVDGGGWWGRIGTPTNPKFYQPGWVWVEAWCWCHAPLSRLISVDLVTSPAARSAVVTWLASHGHADAGKDDTALLNALRHACGLPSELPAVDPCDDDGIPF